MATAKVKSAPARSFGPKVLDAISAVGETNEVCFVLRQVKLSDGRFHTLMKRVTVRVKWSPDVQCFVAFDTKYRFATQARSAVKAVEEYLQQWPRKLDDLVQHEAELGKGPQQDLHDLRDLLSLPQSNAD